MLSERMHSGLEDSDVIALFNLTELNVCLINMSSKTVYCSRSMQNSTHAKEELRLDEWIDLFYVYDQFGIQHSLKQEREQKTFDIEGRMLFKTFHQWVRCTFTHLSQGRIACVISPMEEADEKSTQQFIQDRYNQMLKLTDNLDGKQGYINDSQDESKEKERFYEMNAVELHSQMKSICEKFPHGLAMINKHWQLTYANQQMEVILGKDLKSHYKHKIWQLYPIQDYYIFYRHYYMAVETNKPVTFDLYMEARSTYAKVTIFPTDEGMAVHMQDITDKKPYLDALQESEKRFSLLAENIKDVFWICTEDFEEIIFLSPKFEEMFGIPLENRIKDPKTWWKTLAPKEYHHHIFDGYRKMKSENHQMEYEIKTPSGEHKWIRARGFPVKESRQRLIVGLSEDITEMKEKEQLMRQSEQLSAITQMSAGIAHEIKNPLTALKGFMQLGVANPQLRESYNELLLDEINRIESIVNDFMMLSKPDTVVHKENVSARDTVSYVLDLYQTIIKDKGIHIDTAIICPELMLFAEPKRLKQILINVIKNAIEAVETNGRIAINIVCENEKALITVKDNGKGLSEEQLQRLGEPFFSTKKDGTGLGIMVTKKMVADLGGTINFASEPGRGTTVAILLPYYN
ncbi:ATP-binding protein [Thalassobacillus pellis]|uniref:ATP-binding protein n=1 Tax=Thalassobacillus pellis TaxID=748008 RepID=UPI001EF91203|nr:ATP-binding protein [Thalassobacillus pellis]